MTNCYDEVWCNAAWFDNFCIQWKTINILGMNSTTINSLNISFCNQRKFNIFFVFFSYTHFIILSCIIFKFILDTFLTEWIKYITKSYYFWNLVKILFFSSKNITYSNDSIVHNHWNKFYPNAFTAMSNMQKITRILTMMATSIMNDHLKINKKGILFLSFCQCNRHR